MFFIRQNLLLSHQDTKPLRLS